MVDAISNAVRTEILRHLADERLTAMELAERIEIVHSSIHRHLLVLEANGLVSADHPPHQRRGREVRWTTETRRVREVATSWAQYATGGPVGENVDAD